MAVTFGKVNLPTYSYVAGDRVHLTVDMKGDTSYPTGGSVITPSTLGLSEIEHFDATIESGGSTLAAYDYSAGKVKTFTALGTETTNATNQSTKTWRCFIIGKGQPGVAPS